MTAATVPLLAQRIHDALFEQRCARHHLDCRCGIYKHLWCSKTEHDRQHTLDKLLDRIPH